MGAPSRDKQRINKYVRPSKTADGCMHTLMWGIIHSQPSTQGVRDQVELSSYSALIPRSNKKMHRLMYVELLVVINYTHIYDQHFFVTYACDRNTVARHRMSRVLRGLVHMSSTPRGESLTSCTRWLGQNKNRQLPFWTYLLLRKQLSRSGYANCFWSENRQSRLLSLAEHTRDRNKRQVSSNSVWTSSFKYGKWTTLNSDGNYDCRRQCSSPSAKFIRAVLRDATPIRISYWRIVLVMKQIPHQRSVVLFRGRLVLCSLFNTRARSQV